MTGVAALACLLFPRRKNHAIRGGVAESHEQEFDPAGDAEFVEDAEKIVFYGVLAELHTLGDFAVGKSLGEKADDLEFALREQIHAVGVNGANGWRIGQRTDGDAQVLAVRPDLALMHAANASAQHLDGIVTAKNGPRAGAKSLHDCLIF